MKTNLSNNKPNETTKPLLAPGSAPGTPQLDESRGRGIERKAVDAKEAEREKRNERKVRYETGAEKREEGDERN